MQLTKSEKDRELTFIQEYIAGAVLEDDICCNQLRSLWTAYCLRYDLDVDTSAYDKDLLSLWREIEDACKEDEQETAETDDPDDEDLPLMAVCHTYDEFDLYMGEFLC